MRRNVKIYVLLSVLFAEASTTTSIPETKSTNAAVEANDTTRKPTTAHVDVFLSAVWTLEHKPEEAPAEKAEANETSETTVSTKTSSGGPVVVTTVAAGTSSSGLPAGLITKAPAGTTAEPSTAVSTATTETPPSTSTTRTKAEAWTSVGVSTARGEPSTAATTALTETQPSTAATTAKDEARPSFSTTAAHSLSYTTKDALNHTADQLLRSSTSSFTNKTSSATTDLATATVSSLQPTSITRNTSELPSTTSLDNQTVSIFNQTVSHLTASSPTSKKSETSPSTSPELSSTRRSVSTTGPLTSTTSETTSPATTNAPRSTTGNSTSAAGILIPLKPKRLPFPTTRSSPTTRSAPASTISRCEPSKDPPINTIQPCSTRSVANRCLIIITSLAAVATIFMVSTIVLCVKLSARSYRVTKPQQSTEMMCISALLPDKTYSYTRQRNPVPNGVLVYPGGDSDEEGGDNLTLSSFLPDNERYV